MGYVMSFEQSYYENPSIWLPSNYSDADRQRVLAVAEKLPDDVESLLDVGCGNGLFLNHLSATQGQRFQRLCGADRSKAALAHVRTECVEASCEQLPFGDREFDAVTCMEVLEHLPEPVYPKAIREIVRIAARHVILTVPYAEDLEWSLIRCDKCHCRFNPAYHLRSFKEVTLRHLLDGTGFRCREVFFIYRQEVSTERARTTLRFLSQLKRLICRSYPLPAMPVNAVCPACGYSRETGSAGALEVSLVRKTLAMRLSNHLGTQQSWRWICGLYDRVV